MREELIKNIKTWSQVKDEVYGVKGTPERDELEREFEGFKIGLLIRQAREQKNLTQSQLAEIVSKKREYISRVENDGSNLTLKTLWEIVEKGLGGKVRIELEF
ncbi:helix-turn-helix domain-containing protein [Dyadobacter luticola]|uniref:Helix-turn-helix transcriptional regulator n=1 Tax=Dyadobacter luticola TaxID=1979387 RepID=A0A5R9L513_9BACT|nr:helix-turn-helix transcriptional regulator [Dyadobacter luticola]TLV03662.1 helix-turn-helix transcriptional regulator [Dyadobacter luticola]